MPYQDVCRLGDSADHATVEAVLEGCGGPRIPFALPVLKAGERLIAQTANILLFLGMRHGLVPEDEPGRLWTNQLQLTLSDWLVEAHDTHHPLGSSRYYEEQKPEAARRSRDFLDQRLSKFMAYFERVLAANPAGDNYLVGGCHGHPVRIHVRIHKEWRTARRNAWTGQSSTTNRPSPRRSSTRSAP